MLGLTTENLTDMGVGARSSSGDHVLRDAMLSDIKNLSRGGACSSQRYRIFFPWKSLRPLTHSISEKNTAVFFFPERVYMPLTQLFRRSLNKKIGGKGILFQKYYF